MSEATLAAETCTRCTFLFHTNSVQYTSSVDLAQYTTFWLLAHDETGTGMFNSAQLYSQVTKTVRSSTRFKIQSYRKRNETAWSRNISMLPTPWQELFPSFRLFCSQAVLRVATTHHTRRYISARCGMHRHGRPVTKFKRSIRVATDGFVFFRIAECASWLSRLAIRNDSRKV